MIIDSAAYWPKELELGLLRVCVVGYPHPILFSCISSMSSPLENSPLRHHSSLDVEEDVDCVEYPSRVPMRIEQSALAVCWEDNFKNIQECTPCDSMWKVMPHFVSMHQTRNDKSSKLDEASGAAHCGYAPRDSQPGDIFDSGLGIDSAAMQTWEWVRSSDASASPEFPAANSKFRQLLSEFIETLALQLSLACRPSPKAKQTKRVRFESPEGGHPGESVLRNKRSRGHQQPAPEPPPPPLPQPLPLPDAVRWAVHPQGTEEDWERRHSHRAAALDYIKSTTTYQVFKNDVLGNQVHSRSERPRTPDYLDRNTTKRTWEKSVQVWRLLLQGYRNAR